MLFKEFDFDHIWYMCGTIPNILLVPSKIKKKKNWNGRFKVQFERNTYSVSERSGNTPIK